MRRLPTAVQKLPLHVRVSAAIEKLEDRERDVLAMLLLERLSPLEAAGALRLTVREVESSFERAIASLSFESGERIQSPSLRRAA